MAIETTDQRNGHTSSPPTETPEALEVPGMPQTSDTAATEGTFPVDERRRALARAIVKILSKAIVDPTTFGLQVEGDAPVRSIEGEPPQALLRIQGPDAMARMLWPPTPDSFAEAFLRGDIEIDGDVMAAVAASDALDVRRLGADDLRRVVRWGAELRRNVPPGRLLRRHARLEGPIHSRARDLAAIRFHYDIGESFYRLWLDRRMTYSCAYYERADDPPSDLDAAQEAKLDLICRKLALQPGQRLLDIGCGWGSLILFAAERHGVEAVGVTLSERQAAEANRRVAEAGLADHVRAEVRDYRDLRELGAFDAVASVGMFEHVGRANLPRYFESAFEAVRPGGRFLNHSITEGHRRPRFGSDRRPTSSHFIGRYVFPDGELMPVDEAIAAARSKAGFEILDVQMLRPHYALTLAAWVARLEASWDAAVEAAGDEVARTWRLYMSAMRLGFERGELDVAQVLLAKPALDGPAPRPLRPWW
jgi:cyclopropane-fatty-acyl-phospholipid synthase